MKSGSLHHKKRWLLITLIGLVVLGTNYLLIWPATTMSSKPVCGADEHIHTQACYNIDTETRSMELVCNISEHIHDGGCYEKYRCGMEEHSHFEECYDENGQLICEKAEHTHTDACKLNKSDSQADKETKEDWEKIIKKSELSELSSKNLVIIAQGQLGYSESSKNYIISDEGEILGYSRYGEWSGEPYKKWNTAFVGFCMDYAGIQDIPFVDDIKEWINALNEKGLYSNDDSYEPKMGDIAFIKSDKDIIAGIVAGTAQDSIDVIMGDSLNCVRVVNYKTDDSGIMGYCNTSIVDNITVLLEECGDYTVSVSYDDAANLPENVELSVEEIKEGSEEFDNYYDKSVDKLLETSEAENEEDLGVVFAKFFDIRLVADEKTVEPETAVTVNIQTNNEIEFEEGMTGNILQIDGENTEIIDIKPDIEEDKLESVSFPQVKSAVNALMVAQPLAAPAPDAKATYYVWLDGSDGGIMSLYDSPNEVRTVTTGKITLPETWDSPSKYNYKLNGWYDIYNNKYYAPGETATVTKNTVFYADWVAATYDVGQKDEHVVKEVDTSDFIKTNVFDYSTVFNMQSTKFTGSVSKTSHSETWSLVQSGKVAYQNANTLDFIFRDWDTKGKHISYPSPDTKNENQDKKTTRNILSDVKTVSGKDLIDILFNPATEYNTQTKEGVIGKDYIGEANYLYQYMDTESYNYDGTHNGYYYYDSSLNAASYNQTEQRFYVYDYLERTSDSPKDSSGTVYGNSDFLPFNSPYIRPEGKEEHTYTVEGREGVNYQYDAKYNNQVSELKYPGTDYWFGLSSEIDFYLPHNSGTKDSAGKYLNKSLTGQDLTFEFTGDDDVWVFVDGVLVLDIGGLHAVRSGNINFSSGKATVYHENNTATTTNWNFSAGDHKLVIYYMERGGSQSNCAIYFNITPRYAVEITKVDSFTLETLTGAEFSFYMDAACTEPAKLWDSKADYDNSEPSKNTFKAENGIMKCWGFIEGYDYYIKETKGPDDTDYPRGADEEIENEGAERIDDIIHLKFGNYYGNSRYIGEVSPGKDGRYNEGFLITNWNFDQDNLSATFDIANSKIGSTQFMVEKNWNNIKGHPLEVNAYIVADGKKVGYTCELNDDNNWTHIWYGLPKFNERNEEILYSVEEVWSSGYRFDVTTTTYKTKNGEDAVKYIITNEEVDDYNLTSLTVDKKWLDGKNHSDDEVVVHLIANGKDTNMTLTLNQENNWKGTFEDIPYSDSTEYSEDKKINYTVAEEKFDGYQATYSPITENGKGEIITWNTVTGVSGGNTYRFVSGSYALACDSSGALVSAKSDPKDEYQQWVYSGNKLKNVKTQKYLAVSGSNFTTNSTGTSVGLSNSKIYAYVNRTYYYLVLGSNGTVSATSYQNYGTSLTLSQQAKGEGLPLYKVTVSNDIAKYNLPATGGMGIYLYTFGGLLIIMISLVLGYKLRYSRRKEEKI